MRPLDFLGRIKVKLGIVIVLAVVTAFAVNELGILANLTGKTRLAIAVAFALIMIQLLARGMTKPLREMAAAAQTIAKGRYGLRVTATSRDEVGELARAFNAMAADLAEVDRQRRELVANVSHELRTPITGLQAVLENVVDGVSPPDVDTLGTALAQTQRLGRLVAQLLDLSRLDSGARLIEPEVLDLASLCHQAVSEAALKRDDITVRSEVAPRTSLFADPDLLAQVLANLLDNAVRHSPPGGTVLLQACGEGADVRISVSDGGPGIAASERARVFERFSRLDAGRAADVGGAGLGLAITKEIVELHGGSIHVADQETGCRMVVDLAGRSAVSDTTQLEIAHADPPRLVARGAPAGEAVVGMTQAADSSAVRNSSGVRNNGVGRGQEREERDDQGSGDGEQNNSRWVDGEQSGGRWVDGDQNNGGWVDGEQSGGRWADGAVGDGGHDSTEQGDGPTEGGDRGDDEAGGGKQVGGEVDRGEQGGAVGGDDEANGRRGLPARHPWAAPQPHAPAVPGSYPVGARYAGSGLSPTVRAALGAGIGMFAGFAVGLFVAFFLGLAFGGVSGVLAMLLITCLGAVIGAAMGSAARRGHGQASGPGIHPLPDGLLPPPAYVPPPLFPRPDLPDTPVWVLPVAAAVGLVAAIALPQGSAGLGLVLTAVVMGMGVLPALWVRARRGDTAGGLSKVRLGARRGDTAGGLSKVRRGGGAATPPASWSFAWHRFTPWTVALGLLAYAMVSVALFRDAEWLVTPVLLAAFGMAALALSGGGTGWLGAIRGGLSVILALVPVPWFLATPTKRLLRRRRLLPGLASLGVTVVLLSVFGKLFASADPVFSAYLRQLLQAPDWASSMPFRIFLFVVFGVFTASAVLVLMRPVAEPVGPDMRMSVARTLWVIPLAGLNLLFASFVTVQITVLFGGDRRIVSTAGLTYADDARAGFFQLVTVSLFVLGIVAVAVLLLSLKGNADRWILAGLLGLLCAFTLVILVSAMLRLGIYIDAYGLTRLRASVGATIWWLGAVFMLVLVASAVRLARRETTWLPRSLVLLTGVSLLAFAVWNPDARVAETQFAVRGVDRMDQDYLGHLGAEAVPALDRLPEPVRSCVLREVVAVNELAAPDPWNGWNIARERARDLLDRHPIRASAICDESATRN